MRSPINRMALMGALACAALTWGCKRTASSSLQGQSNTSLTFYGLAVDQDGRPLEGARFNFRIEAYPADWTFATRGRANDVSNATAVSDARGRFELGVTGCQLVRADAALPGYRHFCDLDPSVGAVQTRSFGLISWGQVQYKSDPANPAVFVFVKDDALRVTALPSRGGLHVYGKYWIPNAPAWPRQPSLSDVVRGEAASAQ